MRTAEASPLSKTCDLGCIESTIRTASVGILSRTRHAVGHASLACDRHAESPGVGLTTASTSVENDARSVPPGQCSRSAVCFSWQSRASPWCLVVVVVVVVGVRAVTRATRLLPSAASDSAGAQRQAPPVTSSTGAPRSGAYDEAVDVGSPEVAAGSVVSFFLDAMQSPGTYFFAVSSYDLDGNGSVFSNELSAVVP